MAINSKARRQWIGEMAAADGVETIQLGDDEAKLFNADPDAYAARHFGVSVPDYTEWVKRRGVPLCGAQTKNGKPCGQQVSGQVDAQHFKVRHRVLFCARHEGNAS